MRPQGFLRIGAQTLRAEVFIRAHATVFIANCRPRLLFFTLANILSIYLYSGNTLRYVSKSLPVIEIHAT
jgi:hypothetical protein